tara:strand:- start:1559 stop:1864 length:306 start_codon:yes stop_codon:yes gene_type:complete
MKKIIYIHILFLLLTACGGMKEAGKVLRNEKIKTTDEFLVKKNNPLVLPPDYNNMPEPGSISKKKENDEEKIKKILQAPKETNTVSQPSTTEESILNRIRK